MKKMTVVLLMLFAACTLCHAGARDTLRITFIGDVMSHGPQLRKARLPGADSTKASSYDFSSYFQYTRRWIVTSDIAVANMEFPVGVVPYSGYPTFSAPRSLADEVIDAGVDLFLAANNHICDKGRKGLDSTYAIYRSLPVKFTGLYRDQIDEKLSNPAIINAKGFRVAFINFTYGLNGFTLPPPYVVGQMDSLEVKQAIIRARNRGADFIIALPHWGAEYNLDYTSEQRRWKENLYRWGVDMIIGTHPHVPEPVEYMDGRLTAYSLGNYVSNMSVPYSQIGILLIATLVRREDGSIETLPPEVIYLWCGRGGYMESNYTVVPIEEYLERPEAFRDRSQWEKMRREYSKIKQKFKID